jgi:Ankyrin repeats (many copies)
VNDDNADALRHYLKKVERIDRASVMRTGDLNPAFGSVNLVDERQALHAAAAQGKTELVKILLTAGASVHRRDHFGFSPLFAAVRNGHKDVVVLLKETGAHLKHDEDQILEKICEGRPEIVQAYELAR